MSLLADIYISSDSEAVKYDTTPNQFAARVQYTGFSPLELSTLWAAMRNEQWNVALMKQFDCLLQKDGGERLIHKLPSAMVTDLAKFNSEQIQAAAAKWAATDELKCKPSDVQPIIESLVNLSQQAIQKSQNIYLWNCV